MGPGTYSTRLAIDARHLKTGIGTYTRNLIIGLKELQFGPLHILTGAEHHAELSPYCQQLSVINASIYSIREHILVPFLARHDALLHVPHYNAPISYSGSLLVTIHDITHILYRDYRSKWKSRVYASPMLRMAAHGAAHIFTVSEYSKRRLIEYLDIDPDKITVVYNGVSKFYSPGDKECAYEAVASRFHFTLPYILYVGSLKPHKNLETLLDAYTRLCAGKMPDIHLVIAGKASAGDLSIARYAAKLGIDPFFIDDADDWQLANLYRAAEMLVLPSFEEGFGLPIVEAMASGSPVACADAGAMPEIAGNAAIFFDPYDAEDLCGVMKEVLSSPDLRRSLSHKGLLRAQCFTWPNSVARHIPIYDRYLM